MYMYVSHVSSKSRTRSLQPGGLNAATVCTLNLSSLINLRLSLPFLTSRPSTWPHYPSVSLSVPLYILSLPMARVGEERKSVFFLFKPPRSWLNPATERRRRGKSISFNERDACKGVLVNHHMVYKLNKYGLPASARRAGVHLNY